MSYKPNTISIESVKVIKNNSDVYIYWDNPISLYGNIKYKIYKYSSVVIGYKCPNYKYSHRYEPIFELKVTPHHKQQPFTKLNKQRIEGLRNGWDYNFKVKAKNKLGGLGCEISFTIFTYSASLIVLWGILFLICIIILLLSIWWIYSNRSYKTIKALSKHWNEYNRIGYIQIVHIKQSKHYQSIRMNIIELNIYVMIQQVLHMYKLQIIYIFLH